MKAGDLRALLVGVPDEQELRLVAWSWTWNALGDVDSVERQDENGDVVIDLLVRTEEP